MERTPGRRRLGVTGTILAALTLTTAITACGAPGTGEGTPPRPETGNAHYETLRQPPAAYALAHTLTGIAAFNRISPVSAARLYGYTMHAAALAWHDPAHRSTEERERHAVHAAASTAALILEPGSRGGERARDDFDALARRYNPENLPLREDGAWRDVLTTVRDDAYNTDAYTYRYTVGDGPYDWEPTGFARQSFNEPGWGLMAPIAPASASCSLPAPDHRRAEAEATLLFTGWEPGKANDPIVLRWLAGIGSPTPPGQWLLIAANAARSGELDTGETMRLVSGVAVTGFDTSVLLWREKLRHNLLRPETLWTRLGNPAPVLPRETPAHPSYPSGHSGFAVAAATIIEAHIGAVPVTLTLPADMAAPAETTTYPDASTAAAESSRSRVTAGFHYPMDTEAGGALGRCVATAVIGELDTTFGDRP